MPTQTIFPPLWFLAMLISAEDEHRALHAALGRTHDLAHEAYLAQACQGLQWAWNLLRNTPPEKGETFKAYVWRLKKTIETEVRLTPHNDKEGGRSGWRAGVHYIWKRAVCGRETRQAALEG